MEVGAMNTTWTKQGLLGRFGKVATVLHHGLALIGFAAVVLVLVRGKTLFFDESASRSAAVGSIRSIVADRPDRGRAAGALVEEQGLPAHENEHHGREPYEGQTVMQYRRHFSKPTQQTLLCPGGVHCTYLHSFVSQRQIKLSVADPAPESLQTLLSVPRSEED